MKFTVISRGDDYSDKIANQLTLQLIKLGLEHAELEPEIVITIGGDGTLLYAFHKFRYQLDKVAFVGVHTGHLGFYADWTSDEITFLTHAITQKKFQRAEYPLLDVAVHYYDDRVTTNHLALNESTIRNVKTGMALVLDVELVNHHFERFRGDGLCFSTPSGSTAYNKSLGGAIIHPAIDAIQMAEMASINNLVYRTIGSPLIFPKHHQITLRPVNQKDFTMTIDHLSYLHTNVKSIQYQISSKKVCFARYRPVPFWNRVRDSFISEKND